MKCIQLKIITLSVLLIFCFKNLWGQHSPVEVISPFSGMSGMVQISSKEYLIVHDIKNIHPNLHNESPNSRISYVLIDGKNNPIVQKITIPEWEGLYCEHCPKTHNRASDLESICKVPIIDTKGNKTFSSDEFIVVESGSWFKRPGRIYKIKIDFCTMTGEIMGTIQLPIKSKNAIGKDNKDIVGDQYEGCICAMKKDKSQMLILAERGGSGKYKNGIIRWGNLDFPVDKKTIKQFVFSSDSIELNLTVGNWTDKNTNRDITDLYVDKNNTVWASAAEEPEGKGIVPFYSIIYKLGTLNVDNSKPITLNKSLSKSGSIPGMREIYGLKVEALAAPVGGITKEGFTIGFDDETLGGGWRAIK